jgi:predicted short-subunit dehydrogenase-like oxidoreductase (DUF2520 family)
MNHSESSNALDFESELHELVIIGRGKVGQSLSQLFTQQGFFVSNIGRSQSAQITAVKHAQLVFLCVDDASIEKVCIELAPNLPQGCVVSHCSGALDSSVLSSAREAGSSVASTHPLNTFPNLEDALTLFSSTEHGSYVYAEGDTKALKTLKPLFEATGFIILTIEREAKPLYHAACVFACNYLTSLMDMSLETAAAAGLDRDQFWVSLQPLIQTTLENIRQKGVIESLSGPVARGDSATLESHMSSIKDLSNSLKSNYISLGLRTLEIAIKKNELSDAQLSSIRKTLNQTH